MIATAKLLEEFPPIATEAWEQAIANDLKGAGLESLRWQTPAGLAVQPFYREEDILRLQFPHAPPGEFPYARGARSPAGWQIREEIHATDPVEANRAACAALAAGADEIAFCRPAIAS